MGDLQKFDVVANDFGTWVLETLSQHNTRVHHLNDSLYRSKIRLLVLGEAGSFYTDSA